MLLSAQVGDHLSELPDAEQQCVRNAVEKRRREFSTGRFLASRALIELQVPRTAILKGERNEPIWPPGVVGSITHNDYLCLVVVARISDCAGLGIDVEGRHADVRKLSRLILREDELQHASTALATTPDEHVRLAFSAKESIYKAIYPLVRRFVDFTDVSVELQPAQCRFTATAPQDATLNRLIAAGEGAYVYSDDALITGFCLPAD